MNLKLYKQFCSAYQQCVQAALEDSHIRGNVRIVAKGPVSYTHLDVYKRQV